MRDLIVLAVITAFFAGCAAYVRWCDRIIGPDPDPVDDAVDEPVADTSAGTPPGTEAVRS